MSNGTTKNFSDFDEVSCDREVWEINCKSEDMKEKENQGKLKKRSSDNEDEMSENASSFQNSAVLQDSPPVPMCNSCRALQQVCLYTSKSGKLPCAKSALQNWQCKC